MSRKHIDPLDRTHSFSISVPAWIVFRLNDEASKRGISASKLVTEILSSLYKTKPVMLPMDRAMKITEAEQKLFEDIERSEGDALPIDTDEED